MKRLILSLLIALTIITTQAQTVGLVLSGGGAKGIAHIGLIQALEENNIPIDYITGTSMGSIVGALYAMGYTPQEMLAIMTSQEFLNWAFGVIPKENLYYFLQPEKTPEIVTFNLGRFKPDTTQNPTGILKRLIPGSVISPLPMNFAFMQLFDQYTAQCEGNFDNLFVPYRAIAANVNSKREEVFSSGSLGDAVRASMSIPVAFKPITINGDVMYDGGIYDNFPVRPMEEVFHPDIMIGSRLASSDTTHIPLNEQDVVSQLLTFIMKENNYTIEPHEGIVVRCPTQDFTMFDFAKAQAIYKKGYEQGIAMIDSIKSRIPRRVSAETLQVLRQTFRSRTPQLRFSKNITIEGVRETERKYIARQFQSKDTIMTVDDVYRGFIRNISTGKLTDLRPKAIYNERTGLFDLHLIAQSKDGISVGLGGFISSHNANSIYIGGHYHTLQYNSLDFDAGLYLGQSYQAGLISLRSDVGQRLPLSLRLLFVSQVQHYNESVKPFYIINTPTFISNNENYAKVLLGFPISRKLKLEFSAGYGLLADRYYQAKTSEYINDKRDKSTYSMAVTSVRIESNWLDNTTFPTEGGYFYATASYVHGIERFYPIVESNTPYSAMHSYFQLHAAAHYYLPINSPIAIGLRGEIAYNNNTFSENYTATMIQAPAFNPTPSTLISFTPGLRAHKFIAAGILPIWKIMNGLQLRTEFYGFLPFRPIYEENNKAYYGEPFERINFFGEAAIVYTLPWASVSLYGNYCNAPTSQWTFGLTLGFQLFAPKFID